jgi:GNAT superfamily N-acetyltransferase
MCSLTTRPYQSEHDLAEMQALLREGRAQAGDWAYAHAGELAWEFFILSCHLDPGQQVRLWHAGAGRLAAYAMLGEDPSFACQVRSEFQWQGIEHQALGWAGARLAELRGHDPERWHSPLVTTARQDDARRIAFLEEHGFRYRGTFAEVNLLRSLDGPLPEPAVPDGFQVRAFAGGVELSSRAAAQRLVWQPWSVGNVGDDDYARLLSLPGYDPELDLVAVAPDGAVAAYANGWLDATNQIGDFGPVGALPAWRRRGLTRAVLREGLRRMQARGMDRACVSTSESNAPARRLYESTGFEVANRTLDYVWTGAQA